MDALRYVLQVGGLGSIPRTQAVAWEVGVDVKPGNDLGGLIYDVVEVGTGKSKWLATAYLESFVIPAARDQLSP